MEQSRPARWDDLVERFPAHRRTLPHLLRRQADEYGERALAVLGDRTITFAEAPALAARAADALRRAGVGRGDRVALLCSNRAEFLEVLLGAAWLGAVAVPVNTAARGRQLQHVLANSAARLLVIEDELAERFEPLELTAPALEQVRVIGTAAGSDAAAWAVSPDAAPSGEPGPGDPLAILYTSGTTGVSKGVCCPHAQFFWWGWHGVQVLGIEQGDVLLTTLPLFHSNALGAFFHAVLTGSTVVVQRRFSASAFAASLGEHGATVTYLLGAMVPILLSRPADAAESRHRTRVALAPGVPAAAATAFTDRYGIDLIDGFGSTESNFVIAATGGDRRPGSMGIVRPGFEARVVDENDVDVPSGDPGELVLRAREPFAFATGYLGMPEATVAAWRNLWLHTGDRVRQDADGHFYFLDRMKDAIRRRGENISSYEVEQVIAAHAAVAQVAVFPVRSELAEDEVMASVVLRDGAVLTAAELLDHCRPLLPYFAVPRFVDFTAELPTTGSGKVQKFRLREAGVTATTWDRDEHGYVPQR